jgi:hypothetical protein
LVVQLQIELGNHISQLSHLKRLCLIAHWLNAQWPRGLWMDIDVMTTPRPAETKPELNKKPLKVSERNATMSTDHLFKDRVGFGLARPDR